MIKHGAANENYSIIGSHFEHLLSTETELLMKSAVFKMFLSIKSIFISGSESTKMVHQ